MRRRATAACALVVIVTGLVGSTALADGDAPRGVKLALPNRQEALLMPHPTATEAGLVVVLHGSCDQPRDSCPFFSAGATSAGAHLLCPRGNARCEGGGFRWEGQAARTQVVVDARTAAQAIAPVRAGEGATLLGFSIGAYMAVDVAKRRPGEFTGLVLLSASVPLDARSLRAAGVRRVWLGAGDHDQARHAMERTARALIKDGFEARYVSNGPVGHAYPPDMSARMQEAIAWVRRPAGE